MAAIETIQTMNDISVYKTNIDNAISDYISMLNDPNDIENTDTFNGLIDYIYLRVFKPDKRTKQYKQNSYNNNTYSILDYDDTETIYNLWTLYKILCSKYKKTYTQLQFLSMIGIHKETFNNWKNGTVRNATPYHSELVKKIVNECESSMLNKAVNGNSVPAMFVLKAGYGWQENSTININTNTDIQHDTAEQIAARHSGAQLPEKIDL